MEGYANDPNARISETRRQVDEVVGVMKNNVAKMMEREDKLNDLDARADRLQDSSIQFASTSRRLEEKMWWENMKMKLCIGGTAAVLVIIIIIVIAVKTKGSGGDSNDKPTETPSG